MLSDSHEDSSATVIAVYEWRAWNNFLLQALFPHAHRVSAQIGETHADVSQRLPPSLNCLFFHVGLTESASVPIGRTELRDELTDCGVTVLNSNFTDYSKRRLQSACLDRGLPVALASSKGESNELVIIKTNRNYGGAHEKMLTPEESRTLGIAVEPHPLVGSALDYQVCARKDVPHDLWNHSDTIVERYISNRPEVIFRMYLLGERMVIEVASIRAQIKKLYPGIRRRIFYLDCGVLTDNSDDTEASGIPDFPSRLPSDVAQVSCDMGMDFGTLDAVLDDTGTPYIIDVNATPFWSRTRDEEILQFLRGGLEYRGRR